MEISNRNRLDQVVNRLEFLKRIEDGEDVSFSLSFNFDCGVLVDKGIEKLAEAVGEGVMFETINDDIFKYRAYFDYRGYRFVQYCRDILLKTEDKKDGRKLNGK